MTDAMRQSEIAPPAAQGFRALKPDRLSASILKLCQELVAEKRAQRRCERERARTRGAGGYELVLDETPEAVPQTDDVSCHD